MAMKRLHALSYLATFLMIIITILGIVLLITIFILYILLVAEAQDLLLIGLLPNNQSLQSIIIQKALLP